MWVGDNSATGTTSEPPTSEASGGRSPSPADTVRQMNGLRQHHHGSTTSRLIIFLVVATLGLGCGAPARSPEAWCSELEQSARDLDYLVSRDTEEMTVKDARDVLVSGRDMAGRLAAVAPSEIQAEAEALSAWSDELVVQFDRQRPSGPELGRVLRSGGDIASEVLGMPSAPSFIRSERFMREHCMPRT